MLNTPRTLIQTQSKGAALRIIGIDPGLQNTGFGVIDYKDGHFTHIAHGAITTTRDDSLGVRLLAIYNRLFAILDKYEPDVAGIEKLFFARNVTSAISVSQAQGVVELGFAQMNIPLTEYTPNQIKQAVTGTSRADKETVERCVKLILNMDLAPKPDHAADALAAAITRANYGASFQGVQKIIE